MKTPSASPFGRQALVSWVAAWDSCQGAVLAQRPPGRMSRLQRWLSGPQQCKCSAHIWVPMSCTGCRGGQVGPSSADAVIIYKRPSVHAAGLAELGPSVCRNFGAWGSGYCTCSERWWSAPLQVQVAEVAERGPWHPKVALGDNPDKRRRWIIPFVLAAQVRPHSVQDEGEYRRCWDSGTACLCAAC